MIVTIVVLTIINCMGVKLGSRMQSVLMVLKIARHRGSDRCGLVPGALAASAAASGAGSSSIV